MEEKKIKAYKGFNSDMTCRDFQYEVGKAYELPQGEEVEVCSNGFHACENPFDVLWYYNDIDGRYCEVELSGDIKDGIEKLAASRIAIKEEIGFTGLLTAGIEYLTQLIVLSGDAAKIGSSGNAAKIGSSGGDAQIGSSGDAAKISSEGLNAVVMCAGYNSCVRAKVGSWITLAEWVNGKPVCVKTEQVDGERIKADTWYNIENGEFVEC